MEKNRKKLLVTGSSGFIGTHVANAAVDRGYEVVGFDLVKPEGARFDYVVGDITNRPALEKVFSSGIDCVVNLAAITSTIEFEMGRNTVYDTNVTGFVNVLDLAARNNCQRFTYASSSEVYNDAFTETDIDVIKIVSHYGRSKIMNEIIADSYMRQYPNMKIVGTRVFNAYGYGDHKKENASSPIYKFIESKKKGEPIKIFGDGKQARDFIYVEDTANITLDLMEKADNGVYNIGTGIATSYNDVAEMIGGPKEYVQNPLSHYITYKCADTSKLIKAIGEFKFTPIRDGIKKTMTKYQV